MLSLTRRGRRAQKAARRSSHVGEPEAKVTSERMAALTDRGLRRPTNQDHVLAQELPDGSVVLAVADGVGGVGGGETASAETIEGLVAELLKTPNDDPLAVLRRAFSVANQRVRKQAEERPDLAGMASTLAIALVRGDRAWVANAGDSRVYLFHQAQLQQLTLDHTWVAEQVRAGRLTAEEAKTSEFRNVITRAIGIEETVEPDTVGPITLPSGSLLLLCSDGLYRPVSDPEIAEALESGTAQDMAGQLVALANEGGGPDNISVVIFRAGA